MTVREAARMAVASGRSILLRLPAEGARRWHLWLAEALARLARLAVEQAPSRVATPLNRAANGLDRVERRLFRIDSEGASEAVPTALVRTLASAEARGAHDLVIDLDGSGPPAGHPRTIVPLLDGAPADAAAARIILAGRLPHLAIRDGAEARPHQVGLIAIERPEVQRLALDGVLSRVGLMLIAYAEAILAARALPDAFGAPDPGPQPPESARHPLGFGLRTLAGKLRARALRAAGRAERWRLAYRRLEGRTTPTPGLLDVADYHVLKDDGRRYYGDPFGIEHRGETIVLCEEVPDATGKGIISATRILPDGTMPTPRPVLECAYHLSYPQVVVEGGQIWMMPESSANRTIELFRALSFPDRWERHGTLMEGDFHDATIFRHDGRWWITAAERRWQASTWDTLVVYHAPALEGPWEPVATNPVVMDARFARPAGAPYVEGGRLIRPAQDCSAGYGSALALAEVTHLGPDGFRQRIVGRIAFRPGQRVAGPHTWSRVGDWELIDLIGADGSLPRS